MRFIPRLEQAITDRLSPLRNAGILVRALPNRSSDYGEPTNGEVIVQLNKITGNPPVGLGKGRSSAEVECNLFVRLRNLRDGESGAWNVLASISEYLVGFIPDGAVSKMFLRSSELVDHENGWWIFAAVFGVPVLSLETVDVQGITEAIALSFEFEGGQLVGFQPYQNFDPLTVNQDPISVGGVLLRVVAQ